MRHPLASLVLGSLLAGTAPLGASDRQAAPAPPEAMRPPQEPLRVEAFSSDRTSQPSPIGVEQDVYCSGWLGPVDQPFLGAVVSAEKVDSQREFVQGDYVYLNIGASRGVLAGQEFWACRADRVVYKWGSVTEEIGRIYTTPGRVRVICALEDSAIAEIVRSCAEVEVGDTLLPFEPIPIPLVKRTRPITSCDSSNGKVLGHIVDAVDGVTAIATTTVVYLDLGDRDGLVPGDFASVYRTRENANGVRTVLGEVAILKTEPHTAVAVVTMMTDTMYAGDEVELK